MPQGSSKLLDESAPNDPINAYGSSKLEAEKKFISYHRNKNNVDLSIIRPSVLYGPSDPKNTGISEPSIIFSDSLTEYTQIGSQLLEMEAR